MAGVVLILDGIGLTAFCLAADDLGFGQGYGLGPRQIWGALTGICLAASGLSILLIAARSRPGTDPLKPASNEGEGPGRASAASTPEKG